MPETTLLSPPPPPHEQPTLPSTGRLTTSPRAPGGESGCLGGTGRRSVLPPLARGRSPLAARPSSPRHHSSSTTTTGGQPFRSSTTITTTASRRSPPPFRHDQNISTTGREVPAFWEDDSVSDNAVTTSWQNPFDQYLAADLDLDLDVDEDLDITPYDHHQQPPSLRSPPANAIGDSATRPFQANTQPIAGPSRSETQLTTTTWDDSLTTQLTDDLFGDDFLLDSSQTSFSESMPATRKRNAPVRENLHVAKRPRTAGSGIDEAPVCRPADVLTKQNPATTELDLEDLFGESPRDANLAGVEPAAEDLATIDLTEANEVPEELKKPEEDKRIKISAFQCVICMDDVTTLTVTHCGHLYCAQCLHSSLHVEATKGKCPMCRSKIDIKPRTSYTAKTKGYWPLELKLMTTTRKGKRKANPTA